MTDQQNACYTFEAALELAVDMENTAFQNYLQGLRRVSHPGARDILRELALDELDHKHALERALVQGYVDDTHLLQADVPTMNLDYVLKPVELSQESGVREAIVYAMHLEKAALDFYRRMAKGCEGAPMAELFQKIAHDEARHLQRLEDTYEEHFLTEN